MRPRSCGRSARWATSKTMRSVTTEIVPKPGDDSAPWSSRPRRLPALPRFGQKRCCSSSVAQDETIDTDDTFDRAVEAIGLDGEKSGVVVCTVRGPSITPPTTSRFRSGDARGGSRWNSATAKKQTINTLRTMLGAAWRFMAVIGARGTRG